MPSHANFTVGWTITWAEFEDIQRKKMSRIILPSYKNVVFRFRLEFSSSIEGNDAGKFGLSVFYEDGPLCAVDDCSVWYDLRNNMKKRTSAYGKSYQAKRGEPWHWPNFEEKDINTLKNKYSLDASDDLHYSISIAIPLTAFDYKITKPAIEQRPEWFTGIFELLDDVEKADFSDVRFVAGDGGTFYCHQIMVGKQSEELGWMLKNPENEGEKSGVFYFASLDTGSLKSILKYLYTGEFELIELPVPLIIQVADFCDQYGLKSLEKACIGHLWKIVVENPKDAIDILRFADLHPDAKYLKDRAMSVIMENFEKLSLQLGDFSRGIDNDIQGTRLKDEYVMYTMRRLWIWIKW